VARSAGVSPDARLLKSGRSRQWDRREGTPEEAKRTARALSLHEGIFGGFSSRANVAATLRLPAGEMEGKTIAAIICDSGLKCLSTDLLGGGQ